MANEITLKTKLLNHYDDKVVKDNLVLGTGEIAFQTVKVPLKSGGSTDAVLMKVGNNKTAFNELDYVAATAADVYAWAKQAGLSVTVDPTSKGNVVASVSWDSDNNTLKVVKTDAVTPDELKAVTDFIGTLPTTTDAKTIVEYIDKKTEGIATSGALTELSNKVTGVETAISKLDETYATDIALNSEVTRAKAAEKANADAIAAIKDGATLDSFGDVESALNNKVNKVADKSLVSDTEITKLAGVSAGANKVEKSSTNGSIKIDGQETVVYTHPNKHAIADVTGLQDALNGKQKAGNYSEVGHKHVKADITDFAHTHTASEITNLDATIKSYKYATKTELNDVDAKFADYVKSSDYATDKQGINEAIADRYTKAEADGKFALIADAYNDEEVRGLISANAGAIADIKGDYLKTADKTALENKITTNANAIERLTNGVSADEVDGVNDLIQYVKSHGTEVTGMQNNIQANADNIATINNNLKSAAYTESSAYATAAQGATADSALQTVKVLGQSLNKSSNELSVDQAKTALGLGSAAYTASTDYATAAQGLASVTHGDGLVAAFKNNVLNIDFDSTFTFILDANINDEE